MSNTPRKLSTEMDRSTTFEECLLIPIRVYNQRCSSPKTEGDKLFHTITNSQTENKPDANMPDDLKIKLFDQSRRADLKRHRRAYEEDFNERSLQDLLDKMPSNLPFVKDIIKTYLQRHKLKIDWAPFTYELILNGRILPKSNIIRSLLFLLKPETFNYIPPFGAMELRNSLLDIGVPEGWIAYIPNQREPVTVKDEATDTFFTTSPPGKYKSEISLLDQDHKNQPSIAGRKLASPPFIDGKKKKTRNSSPSPLFESKGRTIRRSRRHLPTRKDDNPKWTVKK